ncbi:MAG TPA: tRNA (adenosine(37)-N6)-threonylcarbamoyltransferase complex dimerization subunit type 1 TsaB [Usitatibacteraceae bacterium]|nr:tRNA (adenosine(37)-N6)-threonylcarbamoyltransferase complex dimerization subunit type 1 TsaB [Usitatibacteraceae bacterium]
MNLFAVETSTERLSLAILRDGSVFERDVEAGQTHSDLALPLMRELFAEAKIAIKDLDAIVFGQGPGSFTGVRIACGLAQGLSLGSGVPMLAVETQMLVAEQVGAAKVVVALDARMDEIYLAAYEHDAAAACGWCSSLPPCLVRKDDLPALRGADWVLAGSATASDSLLGALESSYAPQLGAILPGIAPRARDALGIAVREIGRSGLDRCVAARDAAPLYLRNRVALTIEERAAARAVAS